MMASSVIGSRIDYCNSLLIGIKGKNQKFTTTCKVDYTDVTQLTKTAKKSKKEGILLCNTSSEGQCSPV